MPKLKITPKMVLEWRNTIKELKNTIRSKNRGFPDAKRQIFLLIANRYNVDVQTVYRYMTPSLISKMHGYEYKRLTGHLDSFLPQVFNGNPELSLRAISTGIDNLSGIFLKERTLEKLLAGYENKPRGIPIIKTESGNYQLNLSFYKN